MLLIVGATERAFYQIGCRPLARFASDQYFLGLFVDRMFKNAPFNVPGNFYYDDC